MNDFRPDPARRSPPGAVPAGQLRPLGAADADFEYRVIEMPRGTTRAEARRALTDHAEYGRWELARVRLEFGGARRVWLRRRIIRVSRSA